MGTIRVWDIYFSRNKRIIQKISSLEDLFEFTDGIEALGKGALKSEEMLNSSTLGKTDDRYPGYIYLINDDCVYLGRYEKID